MFFTRGAGCRDPIGTGDAPAETPVSLPADTQLGISADNAVAPNPRDARWIKARLEMSFIKPALQRITPICGRGGGSIAHIPLLPRAKTRHDFSKTAPAVRQRKNFGCHWLRQCFPSDIKVWTYTGKASGTQPES